MSTACTFPHYKEAETTETRKALPYFWFSSSDTTSVHFELNKSMMLRDIRADRKALREHPERFPRLSKKFARLIRENV